jgi:Cys-rich repeat protein
MSKKDLFPILLGLAFFLGGCVHSSRGAPPTESRQETNEKKMVPEGECTRDAECPEGFSCWHRLPRGPLPGIPGSSENPGRCYSNEMIRAIR